MSCRGLMPWLILPFFEGLYATMLHWGTSLPSQSLSCPQVSQMQHGLSVVADLTGGDAEMQRAVQEVIQAFGGLDIIVNRCGPCFCPHKCPGFAM